MNLVYRQFLRSSRPGLSDLFLEALSGSGVKVRTICDQRPGDAWTADLANLDITL